jgi:Flp pilus assembly protein TadD
MECPRSNRDLDEEDIAMELYSRANNYRLQFFILIVVMVASDLAGQIVPGEGLDSGLGGANVIYGTVSGPAGRLSRRVQVRLSTMTRGDRISMTDERGNFIFRGVPSGNYNIVIDKEADFEPFSYAVDVIQLRGSPPQTYTLSVRLTPKATSEGKPAVISSELAGVTKEALAHFERAQALSRAGDYRGAVEQLKLAVAAQPKFLLAYSELGVLYLRLNELEKADEALLAALKIGPNAFAPLLNRGIVLFTARRYSEAAPVLRKAVQTNTDNMVGHYFLGQVLANLGLFDEAEKELVLSLSKGPEQFKEGYRILGVIYSSRGEKKKAIISIETYLKLAPKAPDADTLRAVIAKWKSEVGT